MTRPDFRRAGLERALLEGARGSRPVTLGGPPGSGKTTLLRRLQRTLGNEGWTVFRLDLMGAASSPERFLRSALDALPAAAAAAFLPQATEIRRLASLPDRRQTAKAVLKLFALWSVLDGEPGPPTALVLDEFTEIRSLAYFKDLRHIATPFVEALRKRRRGTVLATSYATAAGRLFGLEVLEVPPLTPGEIETAAKSAGLIADGEVVARTTGGWPRYVDAIFDLIGRGESLEAAWVGSMLPGGRLEALCRHTHEALLLRSRGYGICKALLQAIAAAEGQNLTALCAVVGRTPGAVREYLQWLLQVDAIRMSRKRYYFVDPLVREWVRLHAQGSEPTLREVGRAFEGLAALDRAAPGPRPSGVAPAEAQPVLPAHAPSRPAADAFIEID